MANISITKQSSGLYTQNDPARSIYRNDAGGLTTLSACLNVDISARGRISRRRSITRKVTSSAHSSWPIDNKYCLFVSGNNLNLLFPNLSEYETVGTVTSGLPVSCFVLDGIAYWSNGIEKGKIVNGVNQEWVKGDVVSDNKTRIFYDPPPGQHLDFYNSRAYVADGSVVWYSEDYGPDIFALEDSYLSFESDVTMLRHVAGGIYISDSSVTWFLSEVAPKKFKWIIVDDVPALPYSDKNAVGSMIDKIWKTGGRREVAFWLTHNGIMYGDANGHVENISDEKIDLPGKYTTGSILIDGSTLIAQFI